MRALVFIPALALVVFVIKWAIELAGQIGGIL